MFQPSTFSHGSAAEYGRLRLNPSSASDIKKQIKKLKSQKKGFNSEKKRYQRLYSQAKNSNPSLAQSYLKNAQSFKQKAADHQTRIVALEGKLKAIQRFKKGMPAKGTTRATSAGFVRAQASSSSSGTRNYFTDGPKRGMLAAMMSGREEAQGQTVPSSGDLTLANEAMGIQSFGPSGPSAAAVAAEDGTILGDDEEGTPFGRYALIAGGLIAAGAFAYYQYR